MPCYEVAIEARKNDTAEKCMFSAWIRGENTPKAVEEALQKVAYEHPNFGMLRPVCVEEQKLVAAYWQGTSAPRRQWKIVHKYKVEYRSPVSNRELLKKSYVWAVSADQGSAQPQGRATPHGPERGRRDRLAGYGGNNAPDLRLRQGTACPLEAGNAG